MKSVLFVCLGNICRSPMAHGLLRYKAKNVGLIVSVQSAGTSSFHVGETSDPRAIATLKSKGIDILDLRSRLFVPSDFDDFDYIITMDASNQQNVLKMAKEIGHINHPEMVMNSAYPNEEISVPDPYYNTVSGFEDVYKMLDESLDELIKKLQR